MKIILLATAMGCVALAGRLAEGATINWTNTASGGWNTAANWNPNTVPGANDTAIITNAGVTVTLDVPDGGRDHSWHQRRGNGDALARRPDAHVERAVDREPQRLVHGGQRRAGRQHQRGVERNDWLDRRCFGREFNAGSRQHAEHHHRQQSRSAGLHLYEQRHGGVGNGTIVAATTAR